MTDLGDFEEAKGTLPMPIEIEPKYLGDGVYASYDGYQIWLSVDHHENRVIALEPQVMAALKTYEASIILALNAAKLKTTDGE